MKCRQLSKPEATTTRNQNSVTEQRKKPWEKPGSAGGPVPLRPDESVVCSAAAKLECKGSTGSSGLFPMAV